MKKDEIIFVLTHYFQLMYGSHQEKELVKKLDHSMNDKLSRRQRDVLWDRVVTNLSPAEVAELNDCKPEDVGGLVDSAILSLSE